MFDLLSYVVRTLSLGVSLISGFIIERRHLASLDIRERALSHIHVVNVQRFPLHGRILRADYVDGQAVIAADSFKVLVSKVLQLIGGELIVFERVLHRSRREAMVRMLQKADAMGARLVCNVRLETSSISERRRNVDAEIHAYGTAICFEGAPPPLPSAPAQAGRNAAARIA